MLNANQEVGSFIVKKGKYNKNKVQKSGNYWILISDFYVPCAFVLQSFLILELAFLEKNEFSYVRQRVKEKVRGGNGFKF